MKKIYFVVSFTIFTLLSAAVVNAQNIYTYAGIGGTAGYTGDGGFAALAELNGPGGITTDTSGNLYFCDNRNAVVRKISVSGIITTIAGVGFPGYSGDGGPATLASFRNPAGIILDTHGNIYVCDNGNNVIRKINASGTINTIAGNNTAGYSGDGGQATLAQLRGPNGIVVDSTGVIYFNDARNNVVRKIDISGNISTIAGTGTPGYTGDGGSALSAQFSRPQGLTRGANGNLYIADSRNHVVRMINTSGIISTFAGNGTPGYSGDGGSANTASLHSPNTVKMDVYGALFIADSSNTVRVVGTNDTINTFAGSGVPGYYGDGGPATLAKMTLPDGIAFDQAHHMYISTYGNNVIRRIGLPVSGISITSNVGDTLCFGGSFHFTATTVADSAPHYQWLLNGVNAGTDSFGFTHSGLLAGDTISCELLNAAGGVAIAMSNHLIIDSLPRIGIILCPPTICVGNTVNINHAGGGGGTWAISNSSIATLTATPPPAKITALIAGAETVYYILTNFCGTDSAILPVTIINSNVGAISGPKNICTGSTVSYTDTTMGGRWRSRPLSRGIIDSLTGSFTANMIPGPVAITYGFPGCVVMDTIMIDNIGTITGPATLCGGGTATYIDSPGTFVLGKWTISPSAIGAIDSMAGVLTSNPGTGGLATITYSISSVCYTTASVAITQVPHIMGSSNLCAGNSTTYTDSVSGGTWSASPTTLGNFIGAPGNFLSVATGQVTITYTVPGGCFATDTLTIDSPMAIAPITGATHVDSVWNITLADTTLGGVWTSSNPAIATVNSATGIVTGISHGVVTITYTVAGSVGCPGIATYTDTVINAAGVGQVQNDARFGVYPNPSSGIINISWNNLDIGNCLINICDVTGRSVYTSGMELNNTFGRAQIDIASLTQGVYSITIRSEQGYYCGKLELMK